jgi:hypothetical protein
MRARRSLHSPWRPGEPTPHPTSKSTTVVLRPRKALVWRLCRERAEPLRLVTVVRPAKESSESLMAARILRCPMATLGASCYTSGHFWHYRPGVINIVP